jgi:hypothetical protein
MNKLYDTRQLMDLCMQDDALLERLLQLFLEIHVPAARELGLAFRENNMEKVASLAHRMKPSVRQMGIVLLQDDVGTIEAMASGRLSPDGLDVLISRFCSVMEAVEGQLRLELGERAGEGS